MYIDTGSQVPNISLKSRGLADENNKLFDGMETIRNNRIGTLLCQGTGTWLSIFFKSASTSLFTGGTFYSNLNNFHEYYLIQHSLKSGGTKDHITLGGLKCLVCFTICK